MAHAPVSAPCYDDCFAPNNLHKLCVLRSLFEVGSMCFFICSILGLVAFLVRSGGR